MIKPGVYTLPSGARFLQSLAKGLRDSYGTRLSDALILLPTRRAVRAMGDAFADVAIDAGAGGATLLPRLRPLADINPEEPPFEPGELLGQVPPAIDPVQRRFELAALVAQYHTRTSDLPLDAASALAMADPLIEILDDAAMEGVRVTETEAWSEVTEKAATHFQHAATLYKIVETYWPARLKELGLMEPQARRVKLLDAVCAYWTHNPPDYPVIIAGSTGTQKATAKLIKVVSGLPHGYIILPGLDTKLRTEIWDNIDIQHPQASLKALMKTLDLDHQQISDWPVNLDPRAGKAAEDRRALLSEALVPVDDTSDWINRIGSLRARDGGRDIFPTATDGLSLIEAPTDADEARSIALIMREALETDKTCALVTPDQNLAQRVQSALTRWGASVDVSQGTPLLIRPIGTFLLALLDLASDPKSPLCLANLLTHPLCALGETADGVCAAWHVLELAEFRGIRPDSLPDHPLLSRLSGAVIALTELDNLATPDVWAQALVSAAELCANTTGAHGPRLLWTVDAGAQAAGILEGIIAHGGYLPPVDADGFERFLRGLFQGAVVRPGRPSNPQLTILGPLEARLLDADTIILGGLNEGTWPQAPIVTPFLSRGMRSAMKLSLPERRYGLSAHDFAELAAAPHVILTRSHRSPSGPTIASRWVWRLKTLLRGALGEDAAKTAIGTADHYLHWAQKLDQVSHSDVRSAPPPSFAPPLDKRWAYYKGRPNPERRMSVTGFKTWIRDPYAVYADRTLGLTVLDPLDAPLDARQFGSAIHKGIEENLKDIRDGRDGQPLEDHLRDALLAQGFPAIEVAKETARLEVIAQEINDWLQIRHEKGFDILGIEAPMSFTFRDLDFKITGVADLIETHPEGLSILDFKTGSPPSAKEVNAGFDPQLPLAAILAKQGGVKNVPRRGAVELGYVRVKGSNNSFEEKIVSPHKHYSKMLKSVDDLLSDTEADIRKLITDFDQVETTYPSQPRVKYTNKYGDYDHLARRPEWDEDRDD